MRRLGYLGFLLLLAASCAPGKETAQERGASLSEGVLARVGDRPIAVATVQRIAQAQGVPVREARAKAVRDALLEQGAVARGFDKDPRVTTASDGVLAAALVDSIKRETSASPVTDEELARFTEVHWLDLDRPVARRSAHALVQVADNAEPAKKKSALDLAKQIASAVEGISEPEAFMNKARAVPTNGMQVRVEALPPVVADGRVADLQDRPPPGAAGNTFVMDFVNALFQVSKPGAQIGPVHSRFGYHVILFVEVQPAQTVPAQQRRTMLREEVIAARAKAKYDALLVSLRSSARPDVARNAENVLQLLPSPKGP